MPCLSISFNWIPSLGSIPPIVLFSVHNIIFNNDSFYNFPTCSLFRFSLPDNQTYLWSLWKNTFETHFFECYLTNLILSRYFWGIFFPCQIKCIIFGTFTACFLSDIVANKYSSALLNIISCMMKIGNCINGKWKLISERFR